MKKLSYYWLLAYSCFGLIFSIYYITFTDQTSISSFLDGSKILILIFASPFLALGNIFGPGIFPNWLHFILDIILKNNLLIIITIIIVVIISIKGILLLKKKNYSKSFFLFWCFISILNLIDFIIGLILLTNNIHNKPLLIFYPLINAIVIYIAARYLYRNQRNSTILTYN